MCFAACLRWFFICITNSLVGVIINARSGFLSLDVPLPVSVASVALFLVVFSVVSPASWLDLWPRMWVRIGIPRLVFYLNPSKYTQFFKLIPLNNNLKNQPFLKSKLLPSNLIITSADNFKALSNKWYENYKTCKLKGLILIILL